MNIDIKIVILRPTFINARESLPVFVPSTQLGEVRLPAAEPRRLGLISLCRALFGLMFWWVVISLCVRLI
jgi:hypothetical protein